jgi:SAM-dependent methyltransferase
MTLAPTSFPDSASFGAGGTEPYARALRNDSSLLFLHDAHHDAHAANGPHDRTAQVRTMDVGRWNADADGVDLTLLRAVTGPMLDVGCGPGRMVRAALQLGMIALGVDISPAAVELARSVGLPVLERSIFGVLPREGQWQTVLLVDGNIGIGGDVESLLARCAQLITADGEIVIEVHGDADRDHRFTARLLDAAGEGSAEFPWAEIGLHPLSRLARTLGLEVRQSWELDGRGFCRLAAISR